MVAYNAAHNFAWQLPRKELRPVWEAADTAGPTALREQWRGSILRADAAPR